MASLCDKWGIERMLAGSDPSKGVKQAWHTHTGIVERHIALIKSTMLKLESDCRAQGIDVEPAHLAMEASAAHNSLLTFSGVTPNTGVLGISPRELYEVDNTSPDAAFSADQADAATKAVTLRHMARAATLQTVAESRLALASKTRPQQQDLRKWRSGDVVDLYRNPSPKDSPGWRGPAVVLDFSDEVGTATVRWQGRVLDVPFRHIRPHVGFLGLVSGNGKAEQTSGCSWIALPSISTGSNAWMPRR